MSTSPNGRRATEQRILIHCAGYPPACSQRECWRQAARCPIHSSPHTEIIMKRFTFVLGAALMLLLSMTSIGCAAHVDSYQAGLSRESYAAGVDALATARAGGQISDSLAMDCEAARLVVVTAIDV